MKALLFEFISQYSLLSKEEVQLIVDHSNIQTFPKNTFLLKEGQVANTCYLVLKGCVREYIIKDGEEKSTAFYTEGQPVNSFTSASNKVQAKYNLVCMEDCILTVGNQSLEDEMCRLIPRLSSIIRQEVEKHTGLLQDALSKFMISSPEERYLDLLQNRADLLQRVPQHYIAGYIGVKPESLSRIRKRLADE
jgi:CRP-like cAMP-binding protein